MPAITSRRQKIVAIATTTGVAIALTYFIANKSRPETITLSAKAETCFEGGNLCYRDRSDVIKLTGIDGHLHDYRGQTWGIAWGNVNQNNWLDLYLNHHKENNTQGRFPPSHLIIDLGKHMNTKEFLAAGKGDQHSAFFHDFDGDGKDEILETIGGQQGKALDSNKATWNQLHAISGGQIIDQAVLWGVTQAGARGRQAAPFVLPPVLYIAFLNQGRPDGRHSANFMSINQLGRFDDAEVRTMQCTAGNCRIQPYNPGKYRSLSYGFISQDKEVDLALCQSDKDSDIKLLIRKTASLPGMITRSEPGHLSRFCIPSYFPSAGKNLIVTETKKGISLLQHSPKENTLIREVGLPLLNGNRSKDLAVADINNDGSPDIVSLQQQAKADKKLTLLAFYLSTGKDCAPARPFSCYKTKVLTLPSASAPRNFSLADYNNDGTLDILVGAGKTKSGPKHGGKYILLEGKSTGQWITLDLNCPNGTNGIGAVASIKTASGEITALKSSGVRHEVQDDSRLHLGLGSSPVRLQGISITWANGRKTTISSPAINSLISINGGSVCRQPLQARASLKSQPRG